MATPPTASPIINAFESPPPPLAVSSSTPAGVELSVGGVGSSATIEGCKPSATGGAVISAAGSPCAARLSESLASVSLLVTACALDTALPVEDDVGTTTSVSTSTFVARSLRAADRLTVISVTFVTDTESLDTSAAAATAVR